MLYLLHIAVVHKCPRRLSRALGRCCVSYLTCSLPRSRKKSRIIKKIYVLLIGIDRLPHSMEEFKILLGVGLAIDNMQDTRISNSKMLEVWIKINRNFTIDNFSYLSPKQGDAFLCNQYNYLLLIFIYETTRTPLSLLFSSSNFIVYLVNPCNFIRNVLIFSLIL